MAPENDEKEKIDLGEWLSLRRKKLGFSIEDVARDLKTSSRFIRGLEEGNYGEFPAKVYAEGFLKKLLQMLLVEQKTPVLDEFHRNWEEWTSRQSKPAALPYHWRHGPLITPKIFFLCLFGIFLFGFFIFLGFRLIHFTGAPRVVLDAPMEEAVITEPVVSVKGVIEKESRLTVNGREIKIDENGNFDDEIQLASGLNTLEFQAENRFGKLTKITRHVVVK